MDNKAGKKRPMRDDNIEFERNDGNEDPVNEKTAQKILLKKKVKWQKKA
jgi:hypothetical protein